MDTAVTLVDSVTVTVASMDTVVTLIDSVTVTVASTDTVTILTAPVTVHRGSLDETVIRRFVLHTQKHSMKGIKFVRIEICSSSSTGN